jgi:hypothetical protein
MAVADSLGFFHAMRNTPLAGTRNSWCGLPAKTAQQRGVLCRSHSGKETLRYRCCLSRRNEEQ